MKCMQAKLQNNEKDNNNITKMLQLEYLQHFAFKKNIIQIRIHTLPFKSSVPFFLRN